MLWFVGLGISGTKSIPIEVVKIIQEADVVYLEAFTSPISQMHEEEIKNMVNGSSVSYTHLTLPTSDLV